MLSSRRLVADLLCIVWILVAGLALENVLLVYGAVRNPLRSPVHIASTASVARVVAKNSADALYLSLTQVHVLPTNGVAGKTTVVTAGCGAATSLRFQAPFSWLVSTELSRQNTCTLNTVEQRYGLPSKVDVVESSGSVKQSELALITYGLTKKAAYGLTVERHITGGHANERPKPAPLLNSNCGGNTILTVVAHEDDDILFTNPDLEHSLQQGECTVTVFVTAGDDGQAATYWQSRERGAQSAYSAMQHTSANWLRSRITIAGHAIAVAQEQSNPNVYLLFMRLPDGNLVGEGFARSGNQSLLKLRNGNIARLSALDSSASYSSNQLTATLLLLMELVRPTQIHTQSYLDGPAKGDHSDHQIVAQYVRSAYTELKQHNPALQVSIRFYSGYTIAGLPSNLLDTDTLEKQRIFLAYSHGDPMICSTESRCDDHGYSAYLSREYSYGVNDSSP